MTCLLSARDLNLSFGPIPALRDVAIDLWPGEVLAIVGESGSGKTTLLNVMSGRIAPDTGMVASLPVDAPRPAPTQPIRERLMREPEKSPSSLSAVATHW